MLELQFTVIHMKDLNVWTVHTQEPVSRTSALHCSCSSFFGAILDILSFDLHS